MAESYQESGWAGECLFPLLLLLLGEARVQLELDERNQRKGQGWNCVGRQGKCMAQEHHPAEAGRNAAVMLEVSCVKGRDGSCSHG